MEGQFFQLFFFLAWIFVSFFPSVYLGLEAPGIVLENTVFVALKGEDLHFNLWLTIPANQTSDTMTCSDPLHKNIKTFNIPATQEQKTVNLSLELKTLNRSGEYVCQYKSAEAFWFLHIRDGGYQDVVFPYSEFIAVALISGVLLVFSVVGSAFVFRGYWKEHNKKGKPKKEDRKDTQTTQSNVDSLEPRPRSIYDVLDHSATKPVPDQSGTKPKKPNKLPKNEVVQTAQAQHEDESVYENF